MIIKQSGVCSLSLMEGKLSAELTWVDRCLGCWGGPKQVGIVVCNQGLSLGGT